jgi:hypothetical protein
MPTARITRELEMHYLMNDYTDPRRPAEAIFLLHGIAGGDADHVWPSRQQISSEGVEWWAQLMGNTPVSTQIGLIATLPSTDIAA